MSLRSEVLALADKWDEDESEDSSKPLGHAAATELRALADKPELACPFCKEGDFDLIGLRDHLMRLGCAIFENTLTVEQERATHKPGGCLCDGWNPDVKYTVNGDCPVHGYTNPTYAPQEPAKRWRCTECGRLMDGDWRHHRTPERDGGFMFCDGPVVVEES